MYFSPLLFKILDLSDWPEVSFHLEEKGYSTFDIIMRFLIFSYPSLTS